MKTDYRDAHGYAINILADWWRHMPSGRGRTIVFINGLLGWTGATRVHAVTDDFGTLVPVD